MLFSTILGPHAVELYRDDMLKRVGRLIENRARPNGAAVTTFSTKINIETHKSQLARALQVVCCSERPVGCDLLACRSPLGAIRTLS